jgi:hypothetical protein
MKTQITLPATPTCKVIYIRDGTTYFAGMKTPNSQDILQQEMMNRKIGMNQIVRVEPIQPLQPLQRNHPAAQQMAKYMSISDRS